MTDLLLTFTVKVWCTLLYVELLFYLDNEKYVNVEDFILSIV